MTFCEQIAESRELARWVAYSCAGVAIDADRYQHLAAACFHVGLEHHSAICSLIDTNPTASLALFRPQIEAYIRGEWFRSFADEKAVSEFYKKKGLRAERILSDLETVEPFNSKVLTELKKVFWSELSDYTHCGLGMIRLHLSNGAVSASINEEALKNALMNADLWALNIASALMTMANKQEIALQMILRMAQVREKPA